MGKLSPMCLTANTESIYFITHGQTYTHSPDTEDQFELGPKIWVLVKSIGDPVATISDLTWSVVSTLPESTSDFGYYSDSPSKDLACTVDKEGVFTLGYIDGERTSTEGQYQTFFRTMQFNPTIAINSSDSTTSAWSYSSVPSQFDYERDYSYTMVLGTAKDTDATLRNYHLSSVRSEYEPYPKGPSLSVVEADFPKRKVPPMIRPIPMDTPFGGIVDLAYGNNNLYAVHEHGDPKPLPENPRKMYYNRTLRVYPFKNLGDMSAMIGASSKVDWNFSCRDRSASMAVGGQYYFLCKRYTGNTAYELALYTSNGTTTQGPWISTTRFQSFDPLLLSLTPIYPKQTGTIPPLPQYGILMTFHSELFALNLQPDQMSQPWIPLKTIQVSENIRDFKRFYGNEVGCSERCYGDKVWLSAMIGLPLGILLLFLCCVGCCTHARRRRQRQERKANAANAVVVKSPIA